MITVYEAGGVRLSEYLPKINKLLWIDFEPMRFVRRIRLLSEYLRKGSYKVYYLEHDSVPVGYCVVTPGGRRLKCSTEKDIVLGPYYIKKEERGKGYGKELVSLVLRYCNYNYENAYDWIEKRNTVSRKVSEACGFEPIVELSVTKPFRTLKTVENGDDIVYRYHRNPERSS